MITRLGPEHIDQVASLHCSTLTGLLTQLGVPAAASFYAACAKSDLPIGLVDVEGRVLRGFVLGSMHPDRLNGEVLRQNPLDTALSVVGGVFANPSNLTLLLNSVRNAGEGGYDTKAPSLVYLSVAPGARRTGVGRALVEVFSERMRAAGAAYYDLSVDDDNAAAITFYEQLGFRITGSYQEFGKVHRRYRLTLP